MKTGTGTGTRTSNLIIVDWDDTCQKTELGESGERIFHDELINYLNQKIKDGFKVVIATVGVVPEETQYELNKIRLHSESMRDSERNALLLLDNSIHVQHLDKADNRTFDKSKKVLEAEYAQPASQRPRTKRILTRSKSTGPEELLKYMESSTGGVNSKPITEKPQEVEKKKLFIDLINDNPGDITLIGNDLFDQCLVAQLNSLLRGKGGVAEVKLFDGSMEGCDGFCSFEDATKFLKPSNNYQDGYPTHCEPVTKLPGYPVAS
ncbi:MAG: hypothetical protein ACJAW3_001267, partial [Lentimonas sp.]